ncbi:MAG: hypothetical protein K5924_03710 [Chloroflexi bacterium]|nr:hypothetical protein [Chloroflexota bacterium]
MRSAFIAMILVLGLVACAGVTGTSVPECDESWAGLDAVILVPDEEAEAIPVAIACMSEIDEERIRIGFEAPAGPSCHQLSLLDINESADAVSVRVGVVAVDDPLAGACPDEPVRMVTEADLQAPVGDRELLGAGA